MAADHARLAVVTPARSGEVSAYDALDRQHLELAALERATVLAQREEMVRDDVPGTREPEGGEAGQDPPLVRDRSRQDDVEGRDAIAGDEQQPSRRRARRAPEPSRSRRAPPQARTASRSAARSRRRTKTTSALRGERREVEDARRDRLSPRSRDRHGRARGSRAPRPRRASRAAGRPGTPSRDRARARRAPAAGAG